MTDAVAEWLKRRHAAYQAGYAAAAGLVVGSEFLGAILTAEKLGYGGELHVAHFRAGYARGMYVAGLRPGYFSVDWGKRMITEIRS